ncbi:hypothetical protein BZL30_6706 [Mycobacterium kansasii]|uniref:Uncharacterized protein n=1 Tax=Mycobacterium kansasii TaxID=1768 RepID=A0A1V3X692_MYCKA|nr:hypothetical protein BZL30_6706 [Mycobacterium kansasii]OOK74587.1 hypothetical protein BZL29_4697 [Mycobacterium kansasii]
MVIGEQHYRRGSVDFCGEGPGGPGRPAPPLGKPPASR